MNNPEDCIENFAIRIFRGGGLYGTGETDVQFDATVHRLAHIFLGLP